MGLIVVLCLTSVTSRSRTNVSWGGCAIERGVSLPTKILIRELLYHAVGSIVRGRHLHSGIGLIRWLWRLELLLYVWLSVVVGLRLGD